MRAVAITSMVIALLALSVGSIAAQDDRPGQVLARDAGDLYCVRASEEVVADRLDEAVRTGEVTITVVPDGECGSAAFDALADAEHYGIFGMHIGSLEEPLYEFGEELEALDSLAAAEDAGSLIAELAADPDRMAAFLAPIDRALAFLDDELAWTEAHPPRPCYAEAHAGLSDFLARAAAMLRSATTAIRAQDAERMARAFAAVGSFDASDSLAAISRQTCL